MTTTMTTTMMMTTTMTMINCNSVQFDLWGLRGLPPRQVPPSEDLRLSISKHRCSSPPSASLPLPLPLPGPPGLILSGAEPWGLPLQGPSTAANHASLLRTLGICRESAPSAPGQEERACLLTARGTQGANSYFLRSSAQHLTSKDQISLQDIGKATVKFSPFIKHNALYSYSAKTTPSCKFCCGSL